jgi:hypothetical protein
MMRVWGEVCMSYNRSGNARNLGLDSCCHVETELAGGLAAPFQRTLDAPLWRHMDFALS